MIHEAADFEPNDMDFGWGADGRNIAEQQGVYVYFVEVRYVNGKTEIFKGDVSLMR